MNPPAGAILHVAAEGVGGVVAVEIWRTEQTFRAVPRATGSGQRCACTAFTATRSSRSSALHNVYAPELFTIERMGAVSLPAHLAGAAL